MHKRKSTPWARRRRRLLIVCALFLLLGSPAIIWRMGLRTEVREEVAAIKALGVPTSPEDFAAWQAEHPDLPPIEAYRQASAALALLPPELDQTFPSFRARHSGEEVFAVPYAPETGAVMRQLVDLNGETLRLLREGRAQVQPGQPCGSGRGRTTRGIMELLCARICVAAEAGDGAESAETVLDGFAFIRATYARPWSRSLEVRGDEVGQLMRALGSAAARVTMPEEKLRAMQSWLEAPEWETELRLSTIQDAARTLQDFNQQQVESGPGRIAIVALGIFDRHLAAILKDYRLQLETIGMSQGEQRAAFAAFKAAGGWRSFPPSGPPMELRVALVAIELLIRYQSTGVLPESLDAINRAGLNLEDDYSDGPLKYRPDGDFVTLYSLGRDAADNGGDGRSDIVFQARLPVH